MLLSLDTSSNTCAVSVSDPETELARSVTSLATGHAARLMAAIDEALAAAGCTYKQLTRIGVAEGPGSFTGLRIGIAAARGLSLALGIPAVGVSTLAALAAQAQQAFPGETVLALIDAHRGEIYAGLFGPDGAPVGEARAVSIAEARQWASESGAILSGSGAALIAEGLGGARIAFGESSADIGVIAAIAASAKPTGLRPGPVYLRKPDAKTQAGFAVERIPA